MQDIAVSGMAGDYTQLAYEFYLPLVRLTNGADSCHYNARWMISEKQAPQWLFVWCGVQLATAPNKMARARLSELYELRPEI
jgi:hypothetical protein